MTNEEKKIAFVAFCIESYKAHLEAKGRFVVDLFEKYGVIDYLLNNYEILHSMAQNEILSEVNDFIQARAGK